MFRSVLGCVVSLLLVASSAAADETQSAALYQQGNELLRTHRYAEAVQRYRAALGEAKNTKALLNLSIALHQLNRNVEAADALAAYLEDPAHNPEKVEFARALLATVTAKLATLRLETDASGAEVLIDGQSVGSTPLSEPLRLDPGRHSIVLKNSAGSTSETLQLAPGEHRQLELQLGSAIPQTTPRRARSVHEARVAAPAAPRNPREERSRSIEGQRLWAIVVGGAGLASLGVGSVFAVNAFSRWHDAEEKCPANRCANRGDLELDDDARRAARISTGAFVVGATALAAGAGLWLTAPGSSSQVRAAISPGDARLVLVRSFQ
ncbi:MAG TPA: PEGA domain-containing protein [Polyangiaceae bacterium]|nr:PEGA domain-containing protein [Polyangiaceae bacterium]